MDSNDIRSHFEARALAVNDDEWSVRELELRYICEAIAQAHEEECRACARRSQEAILPCGHHASNAVMSEEGAHCEMCELKAQVAVMRNSIERYRVGHDYGQDVGQYCHCRNCEVARKALSTAPRVLLSQRFKASTEELCMVLREEHGDSELRTVTPGAIMDGEIVDLLVFADDCSGQPEQAQSSEQSGVVALQADCKAQGPDNEQGYKRARGVIPWQEGDEPPEDAIARLRGRGDETEEE